MKKLLTAALTALTITTGAASAATEKEETVAGISVAIMGLTVEKCDLSKIDVVKVIDQTDNMLKLSGVNPDDYKEGEWTRKVFFIISQTDYLREIRDDKPQAVRAFCKTISEKFPAK
jgi:hypothetical protein